MKIEGKGSKLDTIRLSHKGKGLNFQYILPAICSMDNVLKPKNIGVIEFEDIREIDLFIDSLEHFKKYCELQIGKWGVMK